MENIETLKLLSKSAAAKMLAIGRSTLNHLIEEGSIRITMINGKIKIPIKELNRFVEENTFKQSELPSKLEFRPAYRLRQDASKNESNKNNADKIFNRIKKEVHNGISLQEK